MTLHIFNCCVDIADPQPIYTPEDLTYNEMESVVEIVLEKVLEIDNAIVEYDEPDEEEENSTTLKKKMFAFYTFNSVKTVFYYFFIQNTSNSVFKKQFFSISFPLLFLHHQRFNSFTFNCI